LVTYGGHLSAGFGDREIFDLLALEPGSKVVIKKNTGHEKQGKTGEIVSVDEKAREASVKFGEETFVVPEKFMRDKKERSLKFVWFDEFEQLMDSFFCHHVTELQVKAFKTQTYYQNNSEWTGLRTEGFQNFKILIEDEEEA